MVVGTSIKLTDALKLMWADWSVLSKKDTTQGASPDPSIGPQHMDDMTKLSGSQGDAGKLLEVSPVICDLLTDGQGKQQLIWGVTQAGLYPVMTAAANGTLDRLLLAMSVNGGPTSRTPQQFYSYFLKEPAIPPTTRARVLQTLSNSQLLSYMGSPTVPAGGIDLVNVEQVLLEMTRMSYMGGALAEAVIKYKIPVAVDRGPVDSHVSFWDGKVVHLSATHLAGVVTALGQQPYYQWELIAAAFGHGIYNAVSAPKKVQDDLAKLMANNYLVPLPFWPLVNLLLEKTFADSVQVRWHVLVYGASLPTTQKSSFFDELAANMVEMPDTTSMGSPPSPSFAALNGYGQYIESIAASDIVAYLQKLLEFNDDSTLAKDAMVIPQLIDINSLSTSDRNHYGS